VDLSSSSRRCQTTPSPTHLRLPLLLLPRPAGEPCSLWSWCRGDGRPAAEECRLGWRTDVTIISTQVGDVMQVTGALMSYHSVIEVSYCTVRRPDTSHQLAAWRPRPRPCPCRLPRRILPIRHVSAMPCLNTINQSQQKHSIFHAKVYFMPKLLLPGSQYLSHCQIWWI